jgi:hypothetical protein
MAKRDRSKARRPLLPTGSHLRLRGSRWTYRRAVPARLRIVLGLVKIVRALQTSDLPRAERLTTALDVQVDRLFTVAASAAGRGGGAMSGEAFNFTVHRDRQHQPPRTNHRLGSRNPSGSKSYLN